jgi:protein-disulfide isomerase
LIENANGVNYNRAVSNARISGHFLLMFLATPLLLGGACEKKQKQPADTGAITAADRAGSATDTTPLAGIDASKLDAEKQKLFYTLVGSLGSPCGKAHSLRTSFSTDQSCKRAPFAVKYVLALVEDEIKEGDIRELYTNKYESKATPVKLDVSKAPRVGNDDAPVRIVEFFDYACGACQRFKPVLDKVIEEQGGKAGFYFMMFPLGNWVDSKSAAQASLAAAAQGKFKEMHALLFQNAPQHNRDAVIGYAKQLGLDIPKFEAAYAEAGPQVDSDHAQGKAAGVEHTPTIYFNDRLYQGPPAPKYFGMWIDEEIAVNR